MTISGDEAGRDNKAVGAAESWTVGAARCERTLRWQEALMRVRLL